MRTPEETGFDLKVNFCDKFIAVHVKEIRQSANYFRYFFKDFLFR